MKYCTDYLIDCSKRTPCLPPDWVVEPINILFATKHNIRGTKSFFSKCVSILIDTSDSTEPIILERIKGIIHYILEMMKVYKFGGVIFQFYTFADNVECIGEFIVDTQENLFLVLKNLIYMIKYQSGNANLMAGLKEICSHACVGQAHLTTHIVVATNGHPNIGGDMTTILNYINKLPKTVHDAITMAIIGADQNGIGFRSFGGRYTGNAFILPSNVDNSHTHLFKLTGNEESVCNIGLFVNIMNILRSSVYLPAYGDYTQLIKTADGYFDTV